MQKTKEQTAKREQTDLAADTLDTFVRRIGEIACWANFLLLVTIILQVLLRYGFSNGKTYLEELQWHFYAIAVMVGMSYAQVTDRHVRIDIFHANFSIRKKRIIEIFGLVFFLLPFVYVMFYHSLDFVHQSWRIGEASSSPGGLPARYLIKSLIPISFGLMGLAALSRIYREARLLAKGA